jgi:hypothetical protein
MADPKTFELDELVTRPGTYFNPQTDVLIVVDDSTEARRDALIERFQVTQRPTPDAYDEDVEDEVDELEPDPDPE